MATLEQIAIRRARAIERIQTELERLGVKFELPPAPRAFVHRQESNEAFTLEAIAEALSRVKVSNDKPSKDRRE